MNAQCAEGPVSSLSAKHCVFLAPLLILHLSCFLILVVGASPLAVGVFVVSTFLKCFGITAGYHRLLAHRAYKTSRAFQFVLSVLGALAGQNGPLWWVGHHRHHHRYSDTPRDIHSPRDGFLWSHFGWLLSADCVHARKELVRDLWKLPELRFLERHYYAVHVLHALALLAVGEMLHQLRPDLDTSGLQLVVWGSIVSTVCSYQLIWSANSFCHKFGRRRFDTRDDSRNNVVVALLTLGDGWHNNHHYWPVSARHGFRWWELDINYLILRFLSWFNVVWDLRVPPSSVYASGYRDPSP